MTTATYPAICLKPTEEGSQFRDINKVAAYATQERGRVSLHVSEYLDGTYGVRILGLGVERYAVRHSKKGGDLDALLVEANAVLARLYPADAAGHCRNLGA